MNLAHRPDNTGDCESILKGFNEGVHKMFGFVIKSTYLGRARCIMTDLEAVCHCVVALSTKHLTS
jgi:hypothetical protein